MKNFRKHFLVAITIIYHVVLLWSITVNYLQAIADIKQIIESLQNSFLADNKWWAMKWPESDRHKLLALLTLYVLFLILAFYTSILNINIGPKLFGAFASLTGLYISSWVQKNPKNTLV
ncbi:hypothetical protein [Tellurirhabdus bombi]|uniref:hypothetical protein n=1 Tax=Tellurirhabdus bombi TaxID=2907205 RepID=UPI001F3C4D9C|nr:hypothetical protein [Tellurirhabdus bombi]